MAKNSYVLDGDQLYWCIEWDPGLVVVRMGPGEELEWVALRSPVPNFGGREPLPEDGDPDEYECGDNPQDNLIFIPWDAQFDGQNWDLFSRADQDLETCFQNALAHVNALGEIIESRFTDDSRQWFRLCRENIAKWSGEGVRITTSS